MAQEYRLLLLCQIFLFFHGTYSQSYLESGRQRLNAYKRKYNESKSDILIFLDVSGSVSNYGFQTEKFFVSSFLNELSIQPDATRVAVVTFGAKSKIDVDYIDLEGKQLEDATKCEFSRIFEYQVKHRHGPATNMKRAFEDGNTILENAKKHGWKRQNINTVAFFITDGHWTHDPRSVASKMKNSEFHVDVLSIGVGYTSEWQLKQIASSDDKYIYAPSFTKFKQLARYIRGGKFILQIEFCNPKIIE